MRRFQLLALTHLLLLLTPLTALAQNTLSFTMSTAVNGASVTPTLTWSTSPPAASCTASGDWTGSKAAAGTQAQPSTTVNRSYTLQCSWPGDSIVQFTWIPATLNVGGSNYTDPSSVRIKYSFNATLDPGPLCIAGEVCVDVPDPAAARPTMKTVTGITNTGLLIAEAFHQNLAGIYSAKSGTASKMFTGTVSITQNVVLNFPGAPTGFGAQ